MIGMLPNTAGRHAEVAGLILNGGKPVRLFCGQIVAQRTVKYVV
jgi:hypothetical protein